MIIKILSEWPVQHLISVNFLFSQFLPKVCSEWIQFLFDIISCSLWIFFIVIFNQNIICIVFLLFVTLFFTFHLPQVNSYISVCILVKIVGHVLWQACRRCCSVDARTHADKILRNITYRLFNILVSRNKISNSSWCLQYLALVFNTIPALSTLLHNVEYCAIILIV